MAKKRKEDGRAKTSADNGKAGAKFGKFGGRPSADANVSAHAIVEAAVKVTERPPLATTR